MGTSGLAPAALDSGPLIHLSQIQRIDLLAILPELHVVDAVWREVEAGPVGLQALTRLPNLRRHRVQPEQIASLHLDKTGLHLGELESLALCISERITLLVTDDLRARKAATDLHIQPVGSVGIILKSCTLSMITAREAEGLLWQLHDESSLFVTTHIIQTAIGQLHADRVD
ncbi:MAG TPA: hypothetical protein VIK33_16510 [Anaerolineae bacterium]